MDEQSSLHSSIIGFQVLQHVREGGGMRTGTSLRWILLVLLGINLLDMRSMSALEAVDYAPGSSFAFNPTTGNLNQNFGTVNVQSDSSTGWILQVRSMNNSALKHVGSNTTINYTVTVDGTSVDLSAGNDTTAKTATTLTCNLPGVCSYPVQGTISAGEIDGKPAGSYADTLVFTVINQ